MLCCVLGLILAGMTVATVAQAQPMGQPMGQPGGARGAGFQDQFQEIKRTQMGPQLGVGQQTVDHLLQIESRYQPTRQQLIRESKEDFRRLQQVMSQPSPSDQEVKAILSEIKRKKKAIEDLKTRQGEEEEALLTPVQQARYIMYLQTLGKEARSVRGRGPGEETPMMPQGPREIPVSRPSR
jgi:Spy/CpxP family protein refolding chaperone